MQMSPVTVGYLQIIAKTPSSDNFHSSDVHKPVHTCIFAFAELPFH